MAAKDRQHSSKMLLRFSLYGFLKNQRYFDPFLILFFRQAGLSFTTIGFLVGFRELLINLFEVPSGALADLYGRRRCMIFSFCMYIVSFAGFALSTEVWHFFAAMALFALGDAFRTGTHKAMIFGYLLHEGRSD
ncbi:MAG: MFS transporter, partial [Phycisphaerae bacterium]|nr:MFS transporter [Phycisphaerae bacterium]